MTYSEKELKEISFSLSHILWLGGASDAGKTTITSIIAVRNRWQIYLCDMNEHNHFIARAQPSIQPAMCKSIAKSLDESWVKTTPEVMFQDILDTNEERFPMVCEDLLAMPKYPKILVEGPRLFPKLVCPLLTDEHQALWLLPTENFAIESAKKRDKPQGRHFSSDPEKFSHNFFTREVLLRDYIRREVLTYGLPYIEVDGRESVEEVAEKVENHFLRISN